MCGILGLVRLENSEITDHEQFKVFERLLKLNEDRGRKATGYACFVDDKLLIRKAPLSASVFLKRYRELIYDEVSKASIVIAHVRLPTKGSEFNSNCNHPLFTKSGLVLVHNGWILNDDRLFEKYELERDGEVDSEALLKLVEFYKRDFDTTEAIRKSVSECRGVLTFALVDSDIPNVVWLHRYGWSAPLYIRRTDDLITFSSERFRKSEPVEDRRLLVVDRKGKISEHKTKPKREFRFFWYPRKKYYLLDDWISVRI